MSSKPYSLFAMMRVFFPFFRLFLRKYMVAVFLLTITIGLSLLPPLLYKVIIDDGIKAGNTRSLT